MDDERWDDDITCEVNRDEFLSFLVSGATCFQNLLNLLGLIFLAVKCKSFRAKKFIWKFVDLRLLKRHFIAIKNGP